MKSANGSEIRSFNLSTFVTNAMERAAEREDRSLSSWLDRLLARYFRRSKATKRAGTRKKK